MKRILLKDESERLGVSEEKCEEYVEKLSRMIECKTVWTSDAKYADEFAKFNTVLGENFPNLTKRAEKLVFGDGCFVYVIRGKNAKKNIMLMSHHDVVDGGDGWATDPFVATKMKSFLYGRGVIDTKTPLFAELQAAEELLAEGYDFEGIDLYIGSSNNEEVCGDGMVLATKYFKENGIRFDTVLDEGGAITQGQIPGVRCKSAVVAVHEKSRHVYSCITKTDQKGHGGFGGSQESEVERLCRFISEVGKKKNRIYRGKFYPEVRATFERHVPFMSFPLNVLFGNSGIFSPLIKKIMMGIPAASAMLSTSVTFTSICAGTFSEPQIRAKHAEATMFIRCIREEDLYEGLEKIKAIADKHGVEIKEIDRDYCRPTDFNGEAFERVESLIRKNFPDVAVAPLLLTAGTDARRFTDVADNILRFAPIDLSKEQFATIHGDNEHIGVKNIGECVVFYKDYIKTFKGEKI